MVDAGLDPSHPIDAPVSICCRIDANDFLLFMSTPLPLDLTVWRELDDIEQGASSHVRPVRPSLVLANFSEEFPRRTVRVGFIFSV
jgi:hypothetical protein